MINDDNDIDINNLDDPIEDAGFYTPEAEIEEIIEHLDSYREYKNHN